MVGRWSLEVVDGGLEYFAHIFFGRPRFCGSLSLIQGLFKALDPVHFHEILHLIRTDEDHFPVLQYRYYNDADRGSRPMDHFGRY